MMNLSATAALLVALAACAADDAVVAPDAPPAPIDAPTSCPAQPAMPLPSGQYKLFLATEGVALVKGACDDSSSNCTSLIAQSQSVPPFMQAASTRATEIAALADLVQRSLAPYSIDVVLERPTSGNYWMVVMGGTSQDVIAVANIASAAQALCNASNVNGVSLVFDLGTVSPTFYANQVLSNFGAMLGMAVVMKRGDCMCRAGTMCSASTTSICTWNIDAPVNPDIHSCGRTIQDEPAHLTATLGCR